MISFLLKNRSYLFSVTTIIIVYFGSITHVFAFSDDYAVIFAAFHHKLDGILEMIVSGGRPIYALFTMLFLLTPTMHSLIWVRLLSISGIAALSIILSKLFLIRSDLPRSVCITSAVLIVLMPSFQVYSIWAVAAIYPWAAFLSALSFYIISKNEIITWRNFFISFFLLILSIMTYQPAAMMYWVGAASVWLATKRRLPSLRNILLPASTMFLALATDFVASKALPIMVFNDSNEFSRTALVSNFYQKSVWFISQALTDALNLPSILGNQNISVFVALFIAVGMGFFFLRRSESKIEKIAISVLLIPLSYLPNLLVREDWSSYRTPVALTSLLTLYGIIALSAYLHLFRLSRIYPIIMLFSLGLCAYIAHKNTMVEFVFPQIKEIKLVSRYLSMKSDLTNAKRIYIVPSSWRNSLAPISRYDEFGIPSSSNAWSPPGMIWLILRREHAPSVKALANATVGPLAQAPKGATIVNFGQALAGH